jgi:hypothetical protein
MSIPAVSMFVFAVHNYEAIHWAIVHNIARFTLVISPTLKAYRA